MGTSSFDRIAARIDGMRDLAIDIERQLTAIPALSPASGGHGEIAKARWVEKWLASAGITDVSRIDAPDAGAEEGIRPNVIARIAGRDASRTVWIMSYLDVVPPGEESRWTSNPWKARVDGDRIYGRGVEDNQQGIVSSLLAAKAIIEEKVVPRWNLALLFVADEETGSEHGIRHIIEHGSPFMPRDLVIVPDGGEPDGSMIEVAEKSILWTRFRVMGKQTHGSTPERGINAARAAARLITRLDALYRDFPAKDEVFDPPISTFEPTKREPNVENVNTIPGEEIFYVDARILPAVRVDDVIGRMISYAKEIEHECGVSIEVSHPQMQKAAPPTDPASPVVEMVRAAALEVYGVEARPRGIGGGTVAAHLREAGIPAVVWARMDETCHGFDEYVVISNILGDAKVFAHVLMGG